MTTEITIDYYDELKRKADAWDEKETPKPPLINDFKMFSSEQCPTCGKTLWEGILNYCDKCGQRLKR